MFDLHEWEKESAKYTIAKDMIIKRYVENCPNCGFELRDTRSRKLLAPPLEVMRCDSCMLEYWRESWWPEL